MQSRLMWLVFALFAVSIMSIGIVGCGSDSEDEGSAEKPTESSSTTSTTDEPVVAANPLLTSQQKKQRFKRCIVTSTKPLTTTIWEPLGRPFGRVTIKLPSGQSLQEMNRCQSPSVGGMLKSLSKDYGSVSARKVPNGDQTIS